VVLGRVLASFFWFPFLFYRPAGYAIGAGGPILLGMAAVLVLGAAKRLGRRMEVRADKVAQAGEQDEGIYARALERVYQENLIPAVMPGKRHIHPHLYDRLLAAGAIPSYPRPKAAARCSWTTILTSGVSIGLVILFFQ
jgi:hypothetical protein